MSAFALWYAFYINILTVGECESVVKYFQKLYKYWGSVFDQGKCRNALSGTGTDIQIIERTCAMIKDLSVVL